MAKFCIECKKNGFESKSFKNFEGNGYCKRHVYLIPKPKCGAGDCPNEQTQKGYCGFHQHLVPKKKKVKSKTMTATQIDNKILWPLFSIYIRLRDSEDGYCTCCTCGAVVKYTGTGNCQAGHFISRKSFYLKYLDQNVHAQCGRCNNYGAGEQFKHALFIDEKYGKGTAAQLSEERYTTKKKDKATVVEILNDICEKVQKLSQEKDLYNWKEKIASKALAYYKSWENGKPLKL